MHRLGSTIPPGYDPKWDLLGGSPEQWKLTLVDQRGVNFVQLCTDMTQPMARLSVNSQFDLYHYNVLVSSYGAKVGACVVLRGRGQS